MQRIVLALALTMVCMGAAYAENVVVVTTITTAQQDAETMARTGVLRHCGRAGGRREGIGYSTSGPEQAYRNCCFYCKYRILERGVARGPRGWYAVIRHDD